jgi:sporulation protein YlmC with PRC-barrel domain
LPRRRRVASEERLRELEEKYEGYTVYDNQGSKIGKVDDLFVDEKDHEEYIGVKLGLLGRKSTLIPTEIVRVNENDRTIEVSESKDHVKDAPSFDDDEDVTGEYEERIRSHFGLESLQGGSGGSYGATSGTAASGSGTSDHDEGHSSESSGYASGGGDHESSGETYTGDREASSGTDSEYEENQGATAPGLGASEGSSGTGYNEQSGGSGDAGEGSETSGSSSSGMTGGSGQGSSGSQPGTTRQTEETETFQEGGRTKIRRRVIREEVVDADDPGSSS